MGRLIKLLIILIILGLIALVAYAYVGPFFGADFAPEPSEMRVPITVESN